MRRTEPSTVKTNPKSKKSASATDFAFSGLFPKKEIKKPIAEMQTHPDDRLLIDPESFFDGLLMFSSIGLGSILDEVVVIRDLVLKTGVIGSDDDLGLVGVIYAGHG